MRINYQRLILFFKKNPGLKLFNLGIFFLPSTVLIGATLLLFSLIMAAYKKRETFLKDKWNLPLFLSSGLIILSSLRNTFYPSVKEIFFSKDIGYWDISYSWISLMNWIPLFICFWGFQEYLKNVSYRELFAKSIIAGTFPVIVSFIGQNFFNWEGPLELFDGLIIWFLKPAHEGLTGLFSNQNTAGFWLASVFPFSLLLILNKQNFCQKKIISLIISFFIFYFAILTNSRNALIGLFLSISILLKVKYILIIIFLLLILSPIYFLTYNFISEEFATKFRNYIPINLIKKITRFDLGNILNYPRIEIFSKALKMITLKPILGWGAATFPFIYLIYEGNFKAMHAHNLFLHLAYEFGLPLSLILISMIILLFIKSWGKIKFSEKNNRNLLNKVWITSSLVACILHISDITYYDLRVSLLLWTLLAGLKCIATEKVNSELLPNI